MRILISLYLILLVSVSVYGKGKKQDCVIIDGVSYRILSEKEKTAEVFDYEGSRHHGASAPEWEPFDPDEKNKIRAVSIVRSIKIGNKRYTVTSIAPFSFEDSDITNVFFPPTIEKIGPYAFILSRHLRSISLPDNLKIIPKFCFYGCRLLNSVILNQGIEIIESYAFANDPTIKVMEFPASLIHLGYRAFSGTNLHLIKFNHTSDYPMASIKDVFGNLPKDLIAITSRKFDFYGRAAYIVGYNSSMELVTGNKIYTSIEPYGITFHFGRTLEELKYNPIIIGHEQVINFDPSLTLYVTPGYVSPEFKGRRFQLGCYTRGTPKFTISSDSITKIYIGPETEKSPWGYHIK